MKLLKTIFSFLLDNLFFTLLESTGCFYNTGLAVSFGLYCQFENALSLSGLFDQVLALPSLAGALSMLPVFSNSAVQTLEILFFFSSLILILYHTIKIFCNPSVKACQL